MCVLRGYGVLYYKRKKKLLGRGLLHQEAERVSVGLRFLDEKTSHFGLRARVKIVKVKRTVAPTNRQNSVMAWEWREMPLPPARARDGLKSRVKKM